MTLYLFDLFGTFVFAISGAFRAVKYELDILGVLVLAVATGIGGGIVRDVVMGCTPVAALCDERYIGVCAAAGFAVFLGSRHIATRWDKVMIADAVGLGVFAFLGAIKAEQQGLGPCGILIMSALTATGGGVIRDMLVSEIPAVLVRDFYATAALCGGGMFLFADWAGLGRKPQVLLVIGITTGLRILAMYRHIDLPRVKCLPDSPSEMTRTAKLKRRRNADAAVPDEP